MTNIDMLINSDTKIYVDGILISKVTEINIHTSSSDAFFFCDYTIEGGDGKKKFSYVIRDITKVKHKLVVDCISSGSN